MGAQDLTSWFIKIGRLRWLIKKFSSAQSYLLQ